MKSTDLEVKGNPQMTTTPTTIRLMFNVRPAICRAFYPPGALNHTLHVSETDDTTDCDGYTVRLTGSHSVGLARIIYYVTSDESGWSAQKINGLTAENWYIASDFPTLDHLLTYLAARCNLLSVGVDTWNQP